MDELTKKKCDEHIDNIALFYCDPTVKIRSMPHFINENKMMAYKYIKEQVVSMIGADREQVIHFLLKDSTKHHMLKMLWNEKDVFNFDLNIRDSEGSTVLMNFVIAYLPQMKEKNRRLYWSDIHTLINNGYYIQPEDEVFSRKLYEEIKGDYEKEKRWVKLRVLVRLEDVGRYNIVSWNDKLCYIISFVKGRNFGLGFNSLLNSANHAMTYLKENGEVMLRALQVYGRLDAMLEEDKKGTLSRLINEFLEDKPEQDEKFEALVIELYPNLKKTS